MLGGNIACFSHRLVCTGLNLSGRHLGLGIDVGRNSAKM